MALNILISNDDGYEAKGINVLKDVLKSIGHNVYVVAPDKNQSATSHSLTLTVPLRIREAGKNEWITTGTPTDCVLLATHGLIKDKIDLVFSGINHGPNMGEDVIYSGTVAAAMEGVMVGIPSVAVSMAGFTNLKFDAAYDVIPCIIDLIKRMNKKNLLLNVNIPNVMPEKNRGMKITKLGSRVYADTLIKKKDPRGRNYYWIGGALPSFKVKKGTDFEAIDMNFTSVTPITIDLTDYRTMEQLSSKAKDVMCRLKK